MRWNMDRKNLKVDIKRKRIIMRKRTKKRKRKNNTEVRMDSEYGGKRREGGKN